jgi:hypothetical protein
MKTTEDLSRYVEQWKQCIASAELELQSAKEHLSTVRAEFRAAVLSFVDTEEAKPLLNALYWNTDFPVKDLAKSCGLSSDRAFSTRFVVPITMTATCSKCGTGYETEVRTRTRRMQLLFQKDSYTCGPCLVIAEAELKAFQIKYLASIRRQAKQPESISYAEYLQTEWWDKVRRARLRIAGYQCELCKAKTKLHVHHKTYDNLWNEKREDVMALCPDCHAFLHDMDT